MAYRDFARPEFSRRDHAVEDWLGWLDEQSLVHPVAPVPAGACIRCFGAVGGLRYDGRPFDECSVCHGVADDPLDGFVPIAYSTDDTLESMLHRFKDWPRYQWGDCSWLKFPLGVLLAEFWRQHHRCLARTYGDFDLTVAVPGDDSVREFDHLAELNNVLGHPTLNLIEDIVERNPAETRPRRQEVRASAYTILRPGLVRDARVLLVDDTWTSGASMRSTAATLRSAGATSVVGLTLGRQLNATSGFGTTDLILGQLSDRADDGRCILCA